MPSPPFLPAFFSTDRKIPTIPIGNGRRFRNYIIIRSTNKQPAGMPVCLSSYTTGQIFYMREQNVSIRPDSTILPSNGGQGIKTKCSPRTILCNCKKRKGDQAIPESGKLPAGNQRILPEQGYTYFLLAKLYTNPSFLHPDKFHKAAKRFLAFQPSTQNNITKEMKEKILQIIRNWNFGK